MTTRVAGIASHSHKYVYDDITWVQFELKFREAFGWEITPDEHRWFHAIWTIVSGRKQENRSAAAA